MTSEKGAGTRVDGYQHLSVNTCSLRQSDLASPSKSTPTTLNPSPSKLWGNPTSRWAPAQSLASTPLPSVQVLTDRNIDDSQWVTPLKPNPLHCTREPPVGECSAAHKQPTLLDSLAQLAQDSSQQLRVHASQLAEQAEGADLLEVLVSKFSEIQSKDSPELLDVLTVLSLLAVLTKQLPAPHSPKMSSTSRVQEPAQRGRTRRHAGRLQTTLAPKQCTWGGESGKEIDPLQCVAVSLYEKATHWLVEFGNTMLRDEEGFDVKHLSGQQLKALESMIYWSDTSAVAQHCVEGARLAGRLKELKENLRF